LKNKKGQKHYSLVTVMFKTLCEYKGKELFIIQAVRLFNLIFQLDAPGYK